MSFLTGLHVDAFRSFGMCRATTTSGAYALTFGQWSEVDRQFSASEQTGHYEVCTTCRLLMTVTRANPTLAALFDSDMRKFKEAFDRILESQ